MQTIYHIQCVWIYFFLFFIVPFILLLVLLFITKPLSFGCCYEKTSLFAGQIKEILILFLILILTGPDGPEKFDLILHIFMHNEKNKLPSLIFFLTPGPNPRSLFVFVFLFF